MLRLTVTGYGAAHVLPGGGATAAAVTYGALRRKGYNPQSVGLALAAVSVLVYGALGMLFSGSVIYMLLDRDLGPVSTAASIFFLALTLSVTTVAYAAYRRPTFAKNVAKKEHASPDACSAAKGCGEEHGRGPPGLSLDSEKRFGRRGGSWPHVPQRHRSSLRWHWATGPSTPCASSSCSTPLAWWPIPSLSSWPTAWPPPSRRYHSRRGA